jgi:hypothetical protein
MSMNKIRAVHAKKLKHLNIGDFIPLHESEISPDVSYLEINNQNWKEIKTALVNSLQTLDPENVSSAKKKSEEELKRYQTSQKSTSKKIHQEIIKLSKDEPIMEATYKFYEDGWQFDVAKDDYIQSSDILKKASESKGKELLFFLWREYNIYRTDVCPRNTMKKFYPELKWDEPEHESFSKYYVKKITDPSKRYLSTYTTENSYLIPVTKLVEFFYTELLK